MRLIDVTLRDGGHQVDFDWPLDFVENYLKAVIDIPQIEFIEMGYWKQSGKFAGRFYHVDEELLSSMSPSGAQKLGIMIDFHYCSKEISAYPSRGNLAPGLIRLTSRKEDFESALNFLRELKDHTGARTSLNIFNISNYSRAEILRAITLASQEPPDFIYFADTHGTVDLQKNGNDFAEYSAMITEIGSAPGFHLHNHTGRAFSNYRLLEGLGYEITDASLNGLGKGLGNLALEQVIDGPEKVALLSIWRRYVSLFEMRSNPFGVLTGTMSTADHYAEQAEDLELEIPFFRAFLASLSDTQRDNYDKDALLNFGDEGFSHGNK
jgi:4-hydroxy 2-oxovalerate aldolase